MGILQSNRTNMNTVASVIGMAASFIPYTKNITNVSATGVKVMICPTKDGICLSDPVAITKFADDRSPIQIEDAKMREYGVTAGGNLMMWNVVPTVKVVISVIPCTQDDTILGQLAFSNSEVALEILQTRQDSPASSVTGFGLGKATCKTFGIKFYEGLILSNPPGGANGQPQGSAEANGRWSAHSYTFVFTKWYAEQLPAETPSYVSSLLQTVGIG